MISSSSVQIALFTKLMAHEKTSAFRVFYFLSLAPLGIKPQLSFIDSIKLKNLSAHLFKFRCIEIATTLNYRLILGDKYANAQYTFNF